MLAVSCRGRQGGGHLPCGWQRAAAGAQVLSPMKKGHAGTRSLNLRLQKLLNPPGAAKPEFVRRASEPPSVFRVGDRVIQVPAASLITTLLPQLKPDSEDRRCQCHCQFHCQFALNQGAVCCPRSGKAGFGCGALCPRKACNDCTASRGALILALGLGRAPCSACRKEHMEQCEAGAAPAPASAPTPGDLGADKQGSI